MDVGLSQGIVMHRISTVKGHVSEAVNNHPIHQVYRLMKEPLLKVVITAAKWTNLDKAQIILSLSREWKVSKSA